MDTITVTNDSGQVASFGVDGPHDPRAQVLRQRIARGDLREGDQSGRPVDTDGVNVFAGVRDEKGDLLRSIHGGGLDPEAAGDARGVPSGSGIGAAQAAKDAQVAATALATMAENADAAQVELSETTKAIRVTVEQQADGGSTPTRKSRSSSSSSE